MIDAILLYNGFAIKIETEKYNIRPTYRTSSNGVLIYFEIDSVRFEFFSIEDFIKSDRDYKTALPGYYNIEYFASYRRNTTTLAELNNFGLFNLSNFKYATNGDLVKVKRLSPQPNYTDYYFNTIYQFKIFDSTGNDSIREYSKISDFPPINTDISSPEYSISETTIHSTNDSFTKQYYAKNLGDFIIDWQIADDIIEEDLIINIDEIEDEEKTKKQYARLMTFVCWKIFYIHKDILDFLAITDLSFIKTLYANKIYLLEFPGTTDATIINFALDYDELPLVDKVIAELMHQWGIIKVYRPDLVSDFPQTFDNTVVYDEVYDYYRSLVHFYESLRYQKESLIFPPIDSEEQDSDRRIKYLINLSTTSLLTLPYESRLNILKDFIKESELSEREQRTVVRLLDSFQNEDDADNILDFFLLQNDGITTNFENLYLKLDDARLERYAIINWFVDNQTNRKFFIYILFETWKISKYNFAFVPDGVIPNFEGYNPSGFFLDVSPNGGDKYMPKYNDDGILIDEAETFLEYKTLPGSPSTTVFSTHLSTDISYKPSETLDRYIVTLYEVTTEKTFNSLVGINGGGSGISQYATSRKFGEYHLYQPISLLGYEENLNLKVPDIDAIPIFLFYYAEEFDRIYDLDAAINFAGEVILEVALFFLFGGAGALRHLRHIRQLTKLKHLRVVDDAIQLVGITSNESVIVYKVFSSATEVVSVSASVIMSFFTFQGSLTDNSDEAEAYKKIANVFMYMAIATGVGSGLSRAKANRIADDVLDNTSPSALSQFPDDVIDVLNDLRSKKLNSILNFGNTLDNLGVTPPNVLGTFYNSLNGLSEIKDTFYRDFNTLKDINLWNRLNNTDILNRWQQMAELGIAERRNLNILEDVTRVNAIVRYYGEESLKSVLEGLHFEKRWVFLDNFGAQSDEWFSFLANNPTAINRWSNLTGDGKLFAKKNPEIWLFRFDRLYQNYVKWNRMSDTEILQRFGQKALNLVNEVETSALNQIASVSKNKLRDRNILISGVTDKNANLTSDFYTNFDKKIDVDKGGAYWSYLENMFPNLKSRVDDIYDFNKKNYNMANDEYIKNTGKYPGLHGEVRAIDDLAKQRFEDYLTNPPTEEVFNTWLKNDVLGYNRNIQNGIGQENIIMHTCADCFHILDLVTFINPLQ